MAASSNYKTYNRQPRVLTEETGFSSGMLWTGNNIGNAFLKNIVNYDYDDTTGFLKTRAPIVATPVQLSEDLLDNPDESILPELNESYSLLGVYNICPEHMEYKKDSTQAEELLCSFAYTATSGWLYVFGIVDEITEQTSVFLTCNQICCAYKDTLGVWHRVDCSDVLELLATDALIAHNKLEPIIYGNTIYCTNTSPNTAFTAWRLVEFSTEEGIAYHLFAQHYDDNVHNLGQVMNEYLIKAEEHAKILAANELGYGPETVPDSATAVFEALWLQYRDVLYRDMASQFVGYDWENYKTMVNRVTLSESAVTGYNAARGADIYNFYSNAVYDETKPRILGVQYRDADTQEVISVPRVGQRINICVLLNGTDYLKTDHVLNVFKLKALDGDQSLNESWELITEAPQKITDVGCVVGYTVADENTTLAVNIIKRVEPEVGLDDTTDYTHFYSQDAITRYVAPTLVSNRASLSRRVKPYDLSQARSCCLWDKSLVLWDCKGYRNTLFISNLDNFYYFAVPFDVAVFETDIISCIPYLDHLLVFTTDKIYRLSRDGVDITQEVIQNNMPLRREDAAYLRTIKNMVLFKSGKYYYMVVPKTQSLTGELTIAPIYKNIAGLLDDLSKGVTETLTLMYPESIKLNAYNVEVATAPYSIYAEQDTLRILYKVRIGGVDSFVLFLNYDTNRRAWTTYLEDVSERTLYPAYLTASRIMSFICIDKQGVVYEALSENNKEYSNSFRSLIDTGYRTLANAIKKRFREIHIKLYSATEDDTAFGSAFLVDGVTRRDYVNLKEVYIDEQTVALSPEYDLNTFIVEPTMSLDQLGMPAHESEHMQQTEPPQGSNAITLSNWKLDFSHFKREAPTTIRVPVSGKGYAPRFILMAPTANAISINSINWVYRTMFGR